MAPTEETPPSQPGVVEQARISFLKSLPYYTARAVNAILYFIWNVIRFIGQMFRDAIGR